VSRLARALCSHDLKHYERPCDVDVLQAAGLSGIKKRLGVLILEAREGCAGESSDSKARLRDLFEALHAKIKKDAMRAKLRVNALNVAALMMRELVLDRCQVCQGRGFLPMRYDGRRFVVVGGENHEATNESECTVCFGSGAARRIPANRERAAGIGYDKRLSEWWDAVLTELTYLEGEARRSIFSRLSTEQK
jgi:hypothetical protein